MSMLCDKWLTDFPIIQLLIAEFFSLHPDVARPEETFQILSFEALANCNTYRSLTGGTMILVGGGMLHRPVDVGSAILISDSGMISAPIMCGYFHTRRTIVSAPIFQRSRTVESIR